MRKDPAGRAGTGSVKLQDAAQTEEPAKSRSRDKNLCSGVFIWRNETFSSVSFGFDEDLDLVGTLTVFLQVIFKFVGKHEGRLFFAVRKEHVDLVGIPALA